MIAPGTRSAVLPLQASSGTTTARPRVVLIPFDLPDYITAWTPADNDVLEAAIVAALRQDAKVTIAAAPSGTETPRDRAAIARVGRALRADYLLEGGVSEFGSGHDGPSAGSALQIAFQLFDGRTGALSGSTRPMRPVRPPPASRVSAKCRKRWLGSSPPASRRPLSEPSSHIGAACR